MSAPRTLDPQQDVCASAFVYFVYFVYEEAR